MEKIKVEKDKQTRKVMEKTQKAPQNQKGKESLRRVTFSLQKMVASTVKSAQDTIDY